MRKPAPLADGEMMHARVLAQHAAVGVANFAVRFLRSDPALAEVSVDESRIVAVGNEANLLAVGLRGHRQSQLASQIAHLRLGVSAQGKIGAGQLLLLQAEEEIGLVLGVVHAPAHLIAARRVVKADARVMAGGDALRAHAGRHIQKLIELDEVVAERAGDGRAAGQIIVDEGLHHLLFEAGFEVDDVIGNAQLLRDVAGVVDIVERTASAGDAAFGGQFRQAALVPELHGQAHDALALALQ